MGQQGALYAGTRTIFHEALVATLGKIHQHQHRQEGDDDDDLDLRSRNATSGVTARGMCG